MFIITNAGRAAIDAPTDLGPAYRCPWCDADTYQGSPGTCGHCGHVAEVPDVGEIGEVGDCLWCHERRPLGSRGYCLTGGCERDAGDDGPAHSSWS